MLESDQKPKESSQIETYFAKLKDYGNNVENSSMHLSHLQGFQDYYDELCKFELTKKAILVSEAEKLLIDSFSEEEKEIINMQMYLSVQDCTNSVKRYKDELLLKLKRFSDKLNHTSLEHNNVKIKFYFINEMVNIKETIKKQIDELSDKMSILKNCILYVFNRHNLTQSFSHTHKFILKKKITHKNPLISQSLLYQDQILDCFSQLKQLLNNHNVDNNNDINTLKTLVNYFTSKELCDQQLLLSKCVDLDTLDDFSKNKLLQKHICFDISYQQKRLSCQNSLLDVFKSSLQFLSSQLNVSDDHEKISNNFKKVTEILIWKAYYMFIDLEQQKENFSCSILNKYSMGFNDDENLLKSFT